ncbi:hypothetical protein GCM10022197_31410 [Microlunatus spumicola]|uniref:Uncharacterized protein n=1 Tax=Microlunatus spumicola TaxID=81499 RepID=A0ABP6XU92_9ACTN
MTRVAVGSVGVRVPDVGEVTAPPRGSVPVAVAVLTTAPASTSACVMAYVPVQEVPAPGCRVLVGQVTEPRRGSEIPRFVTVSVPVLVTAKR